MVEISDVMAEALAQMVMTIAKNGAPSRMNKMQMTGARKSSSPVSASRRAGVHRGDRPEQQAGENREQGGLDAAEQDLAAEARAHRIAPGRGAQGGGEALARDRRDVHDAIPRLPERIE